MRDSFAVAWRGIRRSKTLWVLAAAIAAVHFFLPGLVKSDGTEAGAIEMAIRTTGIAASAIIYASVLAVACGAFSREREDGLLALALVRPVSPFSLAAGRWLAAVLLAGCLAAEHSALACIVPAMRGIALPACRVCTPPALPPAEVSAAKAMEAFLAKETTPEAVKKAPRAAVLALLVSKENERYEIVKPGETAEWPFDPVKADGGLSVRTRFSTMYNLQSELNGTFRYMGLEGTVSNNTQAVLEIPLAGTAAESDAVSLAFTNLGENPVMLRPRRDIEILSPGGPFSGNAAKAGILIFSLCGFLAAFGILLSASLSRPVALFSATVLMLAAMMAPDAVSQFPDEFNATAGERAGLAVSRVVSWCSEAVCGASPVADLASGRAIPAREIFHFAVADLAVWPAILVILAAVCAKRKLQK